MNREMKLSELHVDFYVRKVIAHAEVEKRIVDGIAAVVHGTILPPILVTPDGEVIDGRIRFEIHKRVNPGVPLDEVLVPVELVVGKTRTELIQIALLANAGGPMPATREDLGVAVGQLLELNMSREDIETALSTAFSRKLIRERVDWAISNAAMIEMRKARTLVSRKNYTVADAAAEVGVAVEDLQDSIDRREKKHDSIHKIEKDMGSINRSHSKLLRNMLDRILVAYEAESIDYTDVVKLTRQAEGYAKAIPKQVGTFVERFNHEQLSATSRK